MEDKRTAVYGIYSNLDKAESAVNHLLKEDFSSSDVSVLVSDSESTRDFAQRKATKAPEGTATGVTAGGLLGGALGLLAGAGALAIPGLGPLIAAGPIMAALAGVGAGGALGGMVGALVGAGIPEYEAKRYEGHVKNGGVLLSVHCDTTDEIKRAKGFLKATGAHDVSSSEEAAGSRHYHDETTSKRVA